MTIEPWPQEFNQPQGMFEGGYTLMRQKQLSNLVYTLKDLLDKMQDITYRLMSLHGQLSNLAEDK